MLKLDFKNMTSPKLQAGVTLDQIKELSEKLNQVKTKFKTEKQNLGFSKLPHTFEALKADLQQAQDLIIGMNTVVVIGIGGSDLGMRAIFNALKKSYHNELAKDGELKMYFTGDTTDPESILDLVEILDLEKTLFIVISKSGNTIEQSSTFIYFRDLVNRIIGEGQDLKHFVFLTDPATGTLRELSNTKGYKTIAIPSDVGGRFSVLTSVGMVPAHLLGLNVEDILKGAADLDRQLDISGVDEDIALQYAALQYLYYKSGKNISVLMPYRYSLKEFARWFRQLWAESLGKRLDVNGNEVFEGMTPVAALGPTDQHSQLQLYNEGPNDKVFTLISTKEFKNEIILPENLQGLDQFDFLKSRKMGDILNLEMETTSFALTKNNRPNCTIWIDKLDEYHLGQLFYFFEIVTTYMGYLLNVNSFDQPGVELSKNAMYAMLGKSGFENEKSEFEAYKNSTL